jgi:hypothetical protein
MSEIGNKNAFKNGAEAAVVDIRHGAPLRDLAATSQQDVHRDLEDHGASYLVREQAERLHAVSRLFWDACLAAAQNGDIQQLDSMVARFGWLASSSLRAWQLVQAEDKKHGPTLDHMLNKGGEDD